MLRQVITNLTHRLDSLGVDAPGWTGARAVRPDTISCMYAGEGFRYLAAVAVLYAESTSGWSATTSPKRWD
jgi:hypothetical protein